MKQLENGRTIDATIPDGYIIVIRIYTNIGKMPVGSALLCVHDHYAEVLHIYVERPYRGQGFAQDLVREIQERHSYVITGWTASEPAGRELFLKMGFEVKKPLHKNRCSTLEWKR
jgi:GNAT superfamily N-acetyltransferase